MQKSIYLAIIAIILVAIGFTALMLILKYDEKGETNMPFEVTKISLISTANAEDVKDDKNTWNKLVGEDNDIYIYIDKNKNYTKKEIIEKVVLDNFIVVQEPKKGEVSIYRPSTNKDTIFENKNEYISSEIIFTGEQSTEIQKLQISNQGGIIAFRCSNQSLGRFISNDSEIQHKDLLKKINITDEELNFKVSFDMTIVLSGGKKFKGTITLNLPVENSIESGQSGKEITDLNLVFKRIEN